jgi:RNA-directed DNA polymerase
MDVSTKRQRIAELGKQFVQRSFTSLHHHLDLEWFAEAYRCLNTKSAPGIDGVTVEEYGKDLQSNLESLRARVLAGTYRAPSVRRVQIPKGTGSNETRPIGIPTTEDKVLQRAVQMLLEPLHEPIFRDDSYGFRPGRSPHRVLEALWQAIMQMDGGWVLDVDVRKFFDTLDHQHLLALLQRRVRDGVICRLISKWLHAGVMEEGRLTYSEIGTPQGGVISPLLSNVYLHYVLDEWFATVVQPRLQGPAQLIRFADDFVMVFRDKADADRVWQVLPLRFGKYGLQVHPDKTRLVDFRAPAQGGTGGTFTFLGFTHYWGRSRRGRWVVQRKTARTRFTRAVRSLREWCRVHRHLPVAVQHVQLVLKIRGHYLYYGLTGNLASLTRFYEHVRRAWRYWLDRRTRGRRLNWDRFVNGILRQYPLPMPRIYHRYGAANP